VAQELWRRAAIAGEEFAELQRHWLSKEHEIDFVDSDGTMIEVKSGQASASEFAWFPGVFPRKRLLVVCTTPFETHFARGITLEQFLEGAPVA
jgi:hypothetical protein